MLVALALLSPAWPCAGLVTKDYTEALASSDAQQAILHIGEETVSVEYRVRYTGNASEFAWIIPVPGKVEQVAEGSEERFVALEEATAPTVRYVEESAEDGDGGGCGNGCLFSSYSLSDNAKAGGFETGTARGGGISVVAEGYAGAFEYTVLEAEEADGLVAWLEAEGYDTTISAPSIRAYVEDEIPFSWVAVQLAPDAATTPDGGVVLPPLRIQWSAGDDGELHAGYPARMAATSMLSEVRTELFVLAESRVEPGNGWTASEVPSIAGVDGVDPTDVYADELRRIGTTHAALLTVRGVSYTDEAAGDVYVTRFDTIVAPPTNQADVTFVETGDMEGFATEIVYGDGASGALWLLPIGVGGLLLRRRRA